MKAELDDLNVFISMFNYYYYYLSKKKTSSVKNRPSHNHEKLSVVTSPTKAIASISTKALSGNFAT